MESNGKQPDRQVYRTWLPSRFRRWRAPIRYASTGNQSRNDRRRRLRSESDGRRGLTRRSGCGLDREDLLAVQGGHVDVRKPLPAIVAADDAAERLSADAACLREFCERRAPVVLGEECQDRQHRSARLLGAVLLRDLLRRDRGLELDRRGLAWLRRLRLVLRLVLRTLRPPSLLRLRANLRDRHLLVLARSCQRLDRLDRVVESEREHHAPV